MPLALPARKMESVHDPEASALPWLKSVQVTGIWLPGKGLTAVGDVPDRQVGIVRQGNSHGRSVVRDDGLVHAVVGISLHADLERVGDGGPLRQLQAHGTCGVIDPAAMLPLEERYGRTVEPIV